VATIPATAAVVPVNERMVALYKFTLWMLALGILAFFLYFLPTIIARSRGHHNTMAVFVLNLFLGWTFVGWVVAMVWAHTMVVSKAQNNHAAN